MNKFKLPIVLSSIAVLIAVVAMVMVFSPGKAVGIGEKLIENYMPYVKYNEGIYSALGITTTATITGGDLASSDDLTVADDSTLTGDLSVSGATYLESLTQGGGRTAISTTTTALTLLPTEMDTENFIDVTLNLSSALMTISASSTLSAFAPNSSDIRQIWIKNATSTAGIMLNLAIGTGESFFEASSSPTAVIAPGKYGVLTFIRKATSDFDILFNAFDN